MGVITLCHPDNLKSCGACCGLYNWVDHSRGRLCRLMHERTDAFVSEMRRGRSIKDIKTLLLSVDTPDKLFGPIHNCPFVGFIDAARRRVGCMIHPLNNSGRELRDISLYGAEICNGHECPSFSYLTETEKLGAASVIDDWYLYGLVICDIDLVKEFFTILANLLGEEIKPDLLARGRVREAALAFFSLKESWPFSSKQNRFGKYSFSISEYRLERQLGAQRLSIPPSPYHKIFLSLASDFSNRRQFDDAHRIVEGCMDDFLAAYREAS
jgi:hypothetical protein